MPCAAASAASRSPKVVFSVAISSDCWASRARAASKSAFRPVTCTPKSSARFFSSPRAFAKSATCAVSADNSLSWVVIVSRSTDCMTVKIVSTNISTISKTVTASTKPGHIMALSRFGRSAMT